MDSIPNTPSEKDINGLLKDSTPPTKYYVATRRGNMRESKRCPGLHLCTFILWSDEPEKELKKLLISHFKLYKKKQLEEEFKLWKIKQYQCNNKLL